MEIKKFNSNIAKQSTLVTGTKVVSPISLPQNIVSTINERIGDEYTAHYFYRNAANWCREVNYCFF